MRVLICVTHLLGTGHLSRALTLGRAFSGLGHKVDLISGGTAVANLEYSGITLHQLSPVKSDGVNFTRLLDVNDSPVSEDALQGRRDMIRKLVSEIQPDVLITELFPFGRRILRAEFMALLQAAQALPRPPVTLCSIRDILAPPSNPEKATETDRIINDYFDAVLVHSDQTQIPLSVSWPVSTLLAPKLAYTGYVAPPPAGKHPQGTGAGDVIVTAGGGSVGMALFKVAVQAARLDTLRHWRLLVGGANAPEQIEILRQQAGNLRITIEQTRPDFRQMLPNAAAAVAMCGYNTAMDLLQTGTPAVFVPFDMGGEQEQTLRADSLARQMQFDMVKAADLTAEILLEKLDSVTRNPAPKTDIFDGASQSVRIAERMLEGRL